MISSVPPEPNWRNAPATPQDINRLALTSFLLSFSPLVVWALAVLLSPLFNPPTPENNYPAVFVILSVITVVGLIGSISAIVTGLLAVNWGEQYPPQWVWLGLAQAGLVMGIIDVVLLFVAPFAFLFLVLVPY